MQSLKNKYPNQTLMIIGKGPSLQHLEEKHFVAGPVVTINQAITAVEMLDLSNPIYSLQKDVGIYTRLEDRNGFKACLPVCRYAPDCEPVCGAKVMPKRATLLINKHQSCCFRNYSPRIEITLRDLNLIWDMSSFFVALRLGFYFGCNRYRIISCDAIAGTNDFGTCLPGAASIRIDPVMTASYERQKQIANRVFLPLLDHELITPMKKTA